jgi:hypothetical protein
VHVTGNEGFPAGVAVECDRAFSFGVDAGSRSVRYDPGWYPYDPSKVQMLVAWQVERGSCPLADGLDANWGALAGRDAGVLGRLRVLFDPSNGTAELLRGDGPDPTWIPAGQQLRLSGDGTATVGGETGQVHSDVVIANLGAWPQSGLRPGTPGDGFP